jgi:hypothetical protein
MQQEKLNTRRRVREKSRINRLSEFKAAQDRHHGAPGGGLVPPSRQYETFLRAEDGPKLGGAEAAAEIVPRLRRVPEFGGCRPHDVERMAARMERFAFPGEATMLRQGDSTTPAALIVVLEGTASIFIKAGVPGAPLPGAKEDFGMLVKTLEAPFVVGEGRMRAAAREKRPRAASPRSCCGSTTGTSSWTRTTRPSRASRSTPCSAPRSARRRRASPSRPRRSPSTGRSSRTST